MKRLSLLALVILVASAAAAATLWAWTRPGGVTVTLGSGDAIDMNFAMAGVAMVLIGGLIALAWWIIGGMFVLPGKLGKSRHVSRMKKANQALADGLLAAEAGDASAAARLARKAAKHAEDERLKLLLEARAAEARDDWSGAERAWGELTRLPGGQLAGLRGAATAAAERGDGAVAEARAREALALKTGADWPFNSLFDLQVSRGEWSAALETLAIGEKRGLIKGDSLRRRRAVLFTADAATMSGDLRQQAQRTLADAIRAAPGFPPAAWHGARHLMVDGKVKAAESVLLMAWKARPHPALAQLARRLDPNGTPEDIQKRLSVLSDGNPDHRESRILKAEIAIDEQDWVGAVKALALLVEEKPTARLCLLMERALKGYGDTGEAERWARMAATASREADWSDIDPRGGAFNYDRADWSRLVYAFGDVGELVHARHERFGRELEAGRTLALPAPVDAPVGDGPSVPKAPDGPLGPPLDYVSEDD